MQILSIYGSNRPQILTVLDMIKKLIQKESRLIPEKTRTHRIH